MKKFIFSKFAGYKHATLLKMNFLKGIFHGFWLQISSGKIRNTYFQEHLISKNTSSGYLWVKESYYDSFYLQ